MTDSIALRPVTNEDEAFLLELYKSGRGDDLRGLGWDEDRISEFLGMQYEAQQRFYESEYQHLDDQIVMLKEEPVGQLIVERRDQEFRCIDLSLLPAKRNHGIGEFLIRQLQDEAKRENKPLRLQVIRSSRAVGLLEPLG